MTAREEWEALRDAFRTRDALALLDLPLACPKRRKLALRLVKCDFLPGCAVAELELDRVITLAEGADTLIFLKDIA